MLNSLLFFKLSLFLTITWAGAFTISPIGVQAQSEGERLDFTSLPLASQNEDEDRGRPPNRTSGGSRGPCSAQLIALVPGSGEVKVEGGNCLSESVSALALTSVETPTLWFYVPEQSTAKLSAEFVLLERKQVVHKQLIGLSETPGIIHIYLTLPLETDEQYRWLFSILINPQRPSQNPAVEGLIQRIEPDSTLNSQLKEATSQRELMAIYARNGIWHDALTSLAQLRREAPGDASLTANWSDLLSSVGLGAIAEFPLVDCCTPEE